MRVKRTGSAQPSTTLRDSCRISPRAAVNVARDEARAPLPGHIRPRPLEQDDEPVAESDEIEDVDEAPEEPGGETGEPDPPEVRDGRASSEDGQVPRVAVVKGLRFSSMDCRQDVLRSAPSLLNRDLRDAGQGLSRLVREGREVPDDEELRVAGHGEVRVDGHASRAVERAAGRAAERRAGASAGPQDRPRLQPLRPDVGEAVADRGDGGACPHLDADPREGLGRLCREAGWKRRQQARARFEEHDTRLARVDGAKIALQDVAGYFPDGARELRARRTAADENECQERLPFPGVRLPLRLLEREQDPAADLQRILEALQ